MKAPQNSLLNVNLPCRLCRLLLEHPKAVLNENRLKKIGTLIASTVVKGDSTSDDLELPGKSSDWVQASTVNITPAI